MSFSIENQENKKTNRSEHAAHCGESDLNVSFSGNFWDITAESMLEQKYR